MDEDWTQVVDSSFINAISLDEQSRVVGVRLRDHSELFYHFGNPRINIGSVFRSFLNADSKGAFFNKVLRKATIAQ